MGYQERYQRGKERLFSDESICKENRELFSRFFEFEEYKLQRKNGLRKLDEPCYKTLCLYVIRFRNINSWFCNKPWSFLTKEDIKRVYDDLEDGNIKNQRGQPFVDRRSYYNKVFKSKPFALAGKDALAREVIEFYTEVDKEVRFVDEENFRRIVSVVSKPAHLFLLWLAWDIGENINTLLQLKKRDFVLQMNSETREPEYLVNLPREKLKRSRTARSEPTLYTETVRYGNMVLHELRDDDLVFKFGYRQALKFLKSAVRRSGGVCLPRLDRVSWKDLRSGMACHLLKQGWTTDDINFRLGHKPSSKEIDVYVSHLAIDRRKPKKQLFDTTMERIHRELEEAKAREKLAASRIQRQGEENEMMRLELERTQQDLKELARVVQGIVRRVRVA